MPYICQHSARAHCAFPMCQHYGEHERETPVVKGVVQDYYCSSRKHYCEKACTYVKCIRIKSDEKCYLERLGVDVPANDRRGRGRPQW